MINKGGMENYSQLPLSFPCLGKNTYEKRKLELNLSHYFGSSLNPNHIPWSGVMERHSTN